MFAHYDSDADIAWFPTGECDDVVSERVARPAWEACWETTIGLHRALRTVRPEVRRTRHRFPADPKPVELQAVQ
jgi:hypothetical protein